MRQTFVSASGSSRWPLPLHLVLERPFGGPLPLQLRLSKRTRTHRHGQRGAAKLVDGCRNALVKAKPTSWFLVAEPHILPPAHETRRLPDLFTNSVLGICAA